MVFDKNEEYLYSADMWANKVWTHKKVCNTWHSIIVRHRLTHA
jgi:carboxy-cis,cis-muconate cyclase